MSGPVPIPRAMNRTPPELINSILHFLPSKADLANFRLVQRAFANLGAPFLFRVIPVKPTRSFLSHLVSISQSLDLSRHVKEIFVGFEHPGLMVWAEYQQQLQLRKFVPGDNRTIVWHSHYDLVAQYQEFLGSQEFISNFETAFRSFPRLEALTIDPFCQPACSSGTSLRPRPSLGEMGWYGVRHKSATQYNVSQIFTTLIGVAHDTRVNLVSFKVTSPGESLYYSYINPANLRRTAIVFQNCRFIELSIPLYGDCRAAAKFLLSNPLFPVLASAQKLEELKISNYTRWDGFNDQENLPELFPYIFGEDHVWPNLKRINFPDLNLYDRELIGFLSRHKKTLREVSMAHCYLKSGFWVDIIRFMKENMKLVALDFPELLVDSDGCQKSLGEKDMMVKYVSENGELLL